MACSMCGSFDINDIRLLVDDDADFSNATIYGSPDVTISSGSIIVSGISSSVIPMNSTKYITIGSVNPTTSLLPIELLSFNARANNKIVYLDWKTASEKDNDYFTVERSQKGIDWEKVKNIDAVGNSNAINYYETTDENPHIGQSYYRLKQTDFDGQFSYAAIKPIYISSGTQTVKVYPNPTKNQITIEGSLSELEQITILNILGQEVINAVIVSGQAPILKMDLSRLPNGFYTIKTTNSVVKIIKE